MSPVRSVALDVDAVLADFHGRASEVIRDRWGFRPKAEDFTSWDVTCVLPDQRDKDEMNRVIAGPGFCASLEPFPDAVEAVKRIRESGTEIIFATSPHYRSETWMWERKKWLMQHFAADEEEVCHIHRKHWLSTDALVDDRVKTVERWAARHPRGVALLRRWPFNRHASHLPGFDQWDEALAALGLR